jgi:hypothetical protein
VGGDVADLAPVQTIILPSRSSPVGTVGIGSSEERQSSDEGQGPVVGSRVRIKPLDHHSFLTCIRLLSNRLPLSAPAH